MAEAKGRIVQILGGVVDVEFPSEALPEIYDALEIERNLLLHIVQPAPLDRGEANDVIAEFRFDRTGNLAGFHGFARLLHGGKDGFQFFGHVLTPHNMNNGTEGPSRDRYRIGLWFMCGTGGIYRSDRGGNR